MQRCEFDFLEQPVVFVVVVEAEQPVQPLMQGDAGELYLLTELIRAIVVRYLAYHNRQTIIVHSAQAVRFPVTGNGLDCGRPKVILERYKF